MNQVAREIGAILLDARNPSRILHVASLAGRSPQFSEVISVNTGAHIYGNPYIISRMEPNALFNVLADPTRLRAIMVIQSEGEVCVCELTHALRESQPKISRHLAYLRDARVVCARREGTWMHYRLNPKLPSWAVVILAEAHRQLRDSSPFKADLNRLLRMKDRPERACA